jgi:hypothetical protein
MYMTQPHIASKTVSVKLDTDTRSRLESLAEAREWMIDFGDRAYVARYRYDGELVTIFKNHYFFI